ncbi:LysR family transcriptional regulator [Vibrio sp. ZSDE26]|uniref:LysR family transcriptional regulator n=1 Tax=Vibrio amylolyticus TaxID=2847292 RepID=A0A9X1XJT2_9VIBR|nr:LysR family transcriptional regulator [Vibrio amylolyticus]
MKIDDLKLFIKVIELGSFTAAANALDIPRANVSRRIGDLEKQLGTTLFHRTTRSLSLTNQGEAYKEELVKALDMLDAAHHNVATKSDVVRGVVKIGILPETHELLQPLLFAFLDKYPEVELDIRHINNAFNDMFPQGLDIAFHGGLLKDSDIVARKLIKLDRILVASPDYLTQSGKINELGTLHQRDCICFRWPGGSIDNVWHFDGENITVSPKIVCDSVGFIKRAVMSHRGIGFLPNIYVKKEIEQGQLVTLLPELTPIEEHGWLLHTQAKTLTQTCRLMIDHLVTEIPKVF